jgi:glycosyltransferase involved in cell wall biosynthesis
MSTPAVSIVMSVYNNERYLAAAVDSILAQTFGDFEFVIIDDGSKDSSRQILEGYAAKDSRVRLFSRPNTGVATALNEGIGHCRADLIARMDGDDIAHPQRLEKQVAFMRDHPEVVLLGAMIETVDPLGTPLQKPQFPLDHESLDKELLTGNGWVVCHPVTLMRKWALEKVGRYRVHYNTVEDLDLFLRLAEVGRIANVPDLLLQYRQHLLSVVKTRFADQERLRAGVIREAFERRGWPMPEKLPMLDRVLFTPAEQIRRWAWNAIKQGRVTAARAHARAYLKQKPLSVDSWKLMYCALRGR